MLFEQDGRGKSHVFVDGERLRDGGRDVVAEVIFDDTSHQHRTAPLRTAHAHD